jgi:Skp1 family, tetramerisation domain
MQCLACHRHKLDLLCEAGNTSRIFCNSRCQEDFYIGLKHDGIDDPDMIGLQSSDGILFKVRLEDALQFKTLASLIEDAGPDDYIPLPNIDGATVRLLLAMVREAETGAFLETDQLFKLAYALVYLDNTALLFKFLRHQQNLLQQLIDSSNSGPWFVLLKDILPLIFVSSETLENKQILELFPKLTKENVLMRNACLHFWTQSRITPISLLKFFAKEQGDLSVVKYLVEEEGVYSNDLLVIAVEQENRTLFNYVLGKEQLFTKSAAMKAIEEANSISFLDDLMRGGGGDAEIWMQKALIENARRFTYQQQRTDSSLLLYLIKQMVATRAIDRDDGKYYLKNILQDAIDSGWIDVVKYILSLKDESIFSNNVFTVLYAGPLSPKIEECIAICLQDERCDLLSYYFWTTIVKSDKLMELMFSLPRLKTQAVEYIAGRNKLLFEEDLKTWQTLYRFYPQFLQQFEPNQVFEIRNLDAAAFFAEKVKSLI